MSAPLRQRALSLMRAKDWQGALRQIDEALRLEPRDARSLVYRAQCLTALGRLPDAREAAAEALRRAPAEPALFDAIGGVLSHVNDQTGALAAFDRAVALAPDNAHFIFNRATVRRFVGLLAEAEADYDCVIALKPADYEAYVNRSELRTQSTQRNHIDELEGLLARGIGDWQGEVQIRYALAKEYEDIGAHARSFAQLEQGAAKRREHMQYDVTADVTTVDWICAAFPEGPQAAVEAQASSGRATDAAPRHDPAGAGPRRDAGGAAPRRDQEPTAPSESPIFIVGLPRSGTTLVDRILGSHPVVYSAGELTHFATCIVAAVRRGSGAAPLSRQELVRRSADLDFAALGRDYLDRVAVPDRTQRFTDKMPLNYLYCGLILRALPNARIVHVTRHPMAVCYAMYKTLFKDGYPFSYDLGDIARYYVAYRRLMDHWQATLPGAIHTLNYEALIADQRAETRRLLNFCGLDWRDACLEFQRNDAPTTTASAVQVRRPLYDSSVAQWRHYTAQLAPLDAALRAAGIDTD